MRDSCDGGYWGWDLSANHAAMVGLDEEGRVIDWFLFWGTHLKPADARHVFRVPTFKGDNRLRDLQRLAWWNQLFTKLVSKSEKAKPKAIALEDYAYGAGGAGHLSVAEIGGAARLAVWSAEVPLRLIDVQSVKMFATGKGNATKDQVVEAVNGQWMKGAPFGAGRSKLSLCVTGKQNPDTDLADALTLAHMVRLEAMLRRGSTKLEQLPPHHVRYFLRTTKTQPVNALGGDWLWVHGLSAKNKP